MMDGQMILVMGVVAAAGLYLMFREFRVWQRAFQEGCTGGCGCGRKSETKQPVLLARQELTARLRRRAE